MKNFILKSVILFTVHLANYKCVGDPHLSLEQLKLTQDLIFEDINAIKRKVWVQLTSRINALEGNVDEMSRNKCGAFNSTDNQSGASSGERTGDKAIFVRDDNEKYALLLKSFKNEKVKSRRLEGTLNVLENKMNTLATYINQLEQNLIALKDDAEVDRKKMITLQTSHKELLEETSILNESLHTKDDDAYNMIRKPSFVSEWILIRAQDEKLSKQTVFHGLGTLPYKVDVQIRPTSGPNAGWIFSGDSAMQSDDDKAGEVYGGVVYFYDATNVYITAPIKNNGVALGVVVNTGETNNRRLGNNHQTALEAYVRVKAWAPVDLPEPDMKSDWLPLDIRNKSLTYYELSHGLKEYPGLVNVQIRCNSSNGDILISEGLGATLMQHKYSNAGGVVYAFNDISVRIWTGYVSDFASGKSYHRLLGSADGWDNSVLRGVSSKKGHFRVLAWNSNNVTGRDKQSQKHEENKEFAEWSPFKQFSPDVDLFSFYVQANDGVNQGFRFPGYGSSQSISSPFGGAVYAYNAKGDVRIWRPNPAMNGSLIHVHAPYGDGVNIQASNNAHYVSTLLRAK